MLPISLSSRKHREVSGFTLIELMISMAIVGIISAVISSLMVTFYTDGQKTTSLSRRISNAAVMQSIGNHFLSRADYEGQPVTATLSAPVIQNSPYTQNVGLTIQWMPYVATATTTSTPVICTGTLVDKTLYSTTGLPVNGVEWSAETVYGADGYCGTGTAFFPVNNMWGFTLVQRNGCPNPTQNPNAVVITSNYSYKMQGTPSIQEATVCLPNL